MSYGRIKRSSRKIYRALQREIVSGSREYGFKVHAGVVRWIRAESGGRRYGHYQAYACFRKPSSVTGIARGRGGCTYAFGRTPSSAIGKAIKKFGQRVATRGRR
jgi:hypothetical protein